MGVSWRTGERPESPAGEFRSEQGFGEEAEAGEGKAGRRNDAQALQAKAPAAFKSLRPIWR